MLAEAKLYSKDLKKFLEAVARFEKASDSIAVTSQAVMDCSGPAIDGINQARGRLSTEIAAGVRGPASGWLVQYRDVKEKHKGLLKLAGEYSKTQGAVQKASSKMSVAQAKGVEKAKQDKLHVVVEQKARAFENAKTAFVCSAPDVASEFRTLLRKRDEVKVQLYALFAVSGRAMSDIAALNPNPSGAEYHHPSAQQSAQSAIAGMPAVGGAYNYWGAQKQATPAAGKVMGSSGSDGFPSPGTPQAYSHHPPPPAAGKGYQHKQQGAEDSPPPFIPVV